MQPPKERRLMRFHISERDLLDCLTGKTKLTNIPEGSTLERAYYVFETLSVALVVYNDEFPIVRDGQPIQNFDPGAFKTSPDFWIDENKVIHAAGLRILE